MTIALEEACREGTTNISNRLTDTQHRQYRQVLQDELTNKNIPGDLPWYVAAFNPEQHKDSLMTEFEYWFIRPPMRTRKSFKLSRPTGPQLELLRRCYTFHAKACGENPQARNIAQAMEDYFTNILEKRKYSDYSPNGEFDEISKKLMEITGIRFI